MAASMVFGSLSFERYNGLLGSFHTNNRDIKVRLMRKFLTMSAPDDMKYSMPSDFQDTFEPLCNIVRQTNQPSEVIVETLQSLLWTKAMSEPFVPNCSVWADLSTIELPSWYRLCSFDSAEISELHLQEVSISVHRRGETQLGNGKSSVQAC